MSRAFAALLLALAALGCATSEIWRDPAYREAYRAQRAYDRCAASPHCGGTPPPPAPRRVDRENRR